MTRRDVIESLGVVLMVGGTAAYSVPASAILLGVLLVGASIAGRAIQ